MCVILFLGQVLSNLTRKGAYSLLNSVPRFCELLAIEKNVIVVTVIRKTDTGLKEKEMTRSMMACSEYTFLSPEGTLQKMITKGCVCFVQHRVTQTNDTALLHG